MPTIETILETLCARGITDGKATLVQEYKGVTECPVFEIQDTHRKLAVKIDAPEHTASVLRFYKVYRDISLFPKVLYSDPQAEFFVYEFFEGQKMGTAADLHPFLETIITKIINNYIERSDTIWGEEVEPYISFHDFIHHQIENRHDTSGAALGSAEEARMLERVSKLFKRFAGKSYLTNEDLGVHNIIVNENKLAGIIDPSPAGTIPLYDLLFLCCSTPHNLSYKNILPYFRLLKEKSGFTESDLSDLLSIALYIRIGNCIKHHPRDLEKYKEVYFSITR